MALSQSYMQSTKNLPAIMEAIQDAGVPDKFSNEFLKTLGFSSSNDRSVISVLKSLGFLDTSGSPLPSYKAYKDKTSAKFVLADALKLAYEDVFLANENAQSLPLDKIKGIFASKTGKGESVVEKMATTFKGLCSLANFSKTSTPLHEQETVKEEVKIETASPKQQKPLQTNPTFHYNIQIHLPVTKDISVYNAIFKSLKEHLL